VRILRKRPEESAEILMEHGVAGDLGREGCHLRRTGKLTVDEEPRDLEEAVPAGEPALASGWGEEAWRRKEGARIPVQLGLGGGGCARRQEDKPTRATTGVVAGQSPAVGGEEKVTSGPAVGAHTPEAYCRGVTGVWKGTRVCYV
jgi:hypothetical protein